MFYNPYCLSTIQDQLETIKEMAKRKLTTWKFNNVVCACSCVCICV